MHGKIFGRDPQGLAFFAFFQRVQQRLADIDVERIAVLVFFGFLHAVALGAARRRGVIAPTAFVEHLKNFAQRFVADFSHALGREPEAVVGANDVAFVFERLLDALQIFQILVGFFAENFAQLFEIELRGIAHAALAPTEKAFEAAQLIQNLPRFAHAHTLGTLESELVHKLFQLLHLIHHIA